MVSATAYLVTEKGAAFQEARVELDSLQANEVLVELKATSLCATDIKVQTGKIPASFPVVLGHEGSGIILEVGSAVKHLETGDHVVLSFNSCGRCRPCLQKKTYRCLEIMKRNFGGARPDGTQYISHNGQPVSGCFFGQSSLCNPAIVQAACCVKLDSSLPLSILCTLGCGFQTGAGSIFNVVKPIENQVRSLAIWGCGGVGCAAIMVAHLLRTENPQLLQQIIVVDINDERLDLARELGATDVINSSKTDPSEVIRKLTDGQGVDAALDCTGVIAVVNEMLRNIGSGGCAISIGGPPKGQSASVEVLDFRTGCKSYIGCHQGNSYSPEFIPFLARLYAAGQLPIERLQKRYAVSEINQAVQDMASGSVIKPVLIWP